MEKAEDSERQAVGSREFEYPISNKEPQKTAWSTEHGAWSVEQGEGGEPKTVVSEVSFEIGHSVLDIPRFRPSL